MRPLREREGPRRSPRTPLRGLLAAGLLALGCGGAADGPPPNVLLVTLDTTRADRLGFHGYRRPTTPRLDAFAAKAIVYERAYSTTSWTYPAHASLFTGRYPTSHGARHHPEGELVLADEIGAPEALRARGLGAEVGALAEWLAAAGWRTGGVVAGPWMLESFGLDRGFAHWDDEGIRNASGRRADAVTDRALDWIREGPEPFFLFLNYFDPHIPYWPPPGHRRIFLPPGVKPNPRARRQLSPLYDSEIRYMDGQIGRLFRFLREEGLWERTLVVVTGDHGELLGERGRFGHGKTLWEPVVRVPLVVKEAAPSPRSARRPGPVSLVDVAPLVLDRLGLEAPPGLQGGVPPALERPILAELYPTSPEGPAAAWRAVWRGGRKLLASGDGAHHLFDLRRDPGESRDLLRGRPERARREARRLRELFSELPEPGEPAEALRVEEETLEALRRLGYVEGEERGARPEEGSGAETGAPR